MFCLENVNMHKSEQSKLTLWKNDIIALYCIVLYCIVLYCIVLCIVYCVLCIVYCVLCIVYCVLSIVLYCIKFLYCSQNTVKSIKIQ